MEEPLWVYSLLISSFAYFCTESHSWKEFFSTLLLCLKDWISYTCLDFKQFWISEILFYKLYSISLSHLRTDIAAAVVKIMMRVLER